MGKKTKITALYERLSRDDELQGDSFSIIHQEAICQGQINHMHHIYDFLLVLPYSLYKLFQFFATFTMLQQQKQGQDLLNKSRPCFLIVSETEFPTETL